MIGVKKISIIQATAAQLALLYSVWAGGFLWLFAAAVAFGVMHFYTMEIDYKGVLQVCHENIYLKLLWQFKWLPLSLQVRPFAYMPFPLATAALVVLVFF